MSEKKAVKKKALAVPKDRMELELFVVGIRQKEEAINALTIKASSEIAKLNVRIDAIKKKAQAEAKPIEKEINELAQGVFLFAESHREELTEKEKQKTVEFITGDKIRWYLTPWSVVVLNEADAIIELEGYGLEEFIRVKLGSVSGSLASKWPFIAPNASRSREFTWPSALRSPAEA